MPLAAAKQLPFFQKYYWGADLDSEDSNQSWRRIDDSWLDSSSALALQLDSATNNTCLVLAFELSDGDVLLFAADAQVGNWMSWQDLSWAAGGKKVTGPICSTARSSTKVGHHGSHNATLREKGLEQMKKLELAFVPVDHGMAVKKRWNKMPLNDLMDKLKEMTKDGVVRIDEDVPVNLKNSVTFEEVISRSHVLALQAASLQPGCEAATTTGWHPLRSFRKPFQAFVAFAWFLLHSEPDPPRLRIQVQSEPG